MDTAQIQVVLREHRDQLIAFAVAGIRREVKGYESVPEDVLSRDVGKLVDAVIALIGSDDDSELYQHQLHTVQQRIEAGVTLQQYLRATLLGFPVMRAFTTAAGLPFEAIEKTLIRMVVNAGEAYTRAYEKRVRALEQERQRAEMEANRLRALSELVAGVAHEINTPLGIITTASSMVGDGLAADDIPKIARDEEAQQILSDVADAFILIRKNLGRVDSLVKSFKSLSVHQYSDEIAELDVAELVSAAIALYRAREPSKKLAIEVMDRRANPDRPWTGQGRYLSDILVGLLTNIERYAYGDAGGPAVIELSDIGADGLRVVVADRGRGMPEEHVAKAFEPFFTTGRNVGACGLGLAIVYNLVTQAIGGTVSVASREGEGTRVTLDLPGKASGPSIPPRAMG